MELEDVTDDGLFCHHGLVLHVGRSSWTGGECDLAAVSLPGLGDDCKRADFW